MKFAKQLILVTALGLAGSTIAFAQENLAPSTIQSKQPTSTTIEPYDSEGHPNPDAFEWTGFALGIKFGTLGVGLDASVYLNDWMNFRANASYLKFKYKDTIDDIDYDMDTDFKTGMLLLDLYPFDNGNFRLSGGFVLMENSVTVKGTPTDDQKIGETVYTPEQVGTISGVAEFDNFAPYVGIGYGNAVLPDASLTFVVDFGVIFQSYDITLTSDGALAGDPAFQSDLQQEQEDIQKEVDRFKIYPVINFGIAYHF